MKWSSDLCLHTKSHEWRGPLFSLELQIRLMQI
ncbi:hypothetical protein DOCECA_08145 [Pseudomonas sp. E102]